MTGVQTCALPIYIHQYYESYLPMNHERTLENLNDFKKIIDAMKIHDSATAADIIRDHVERFNKKMQKKTKAAGKD